MMVVITSSTFLSSLFGSDLGSNMENNISVRKIRYYDYDGKAKHFFNTKLRENKRVGM
jgi:hypothetical protein